MRPFRGVDGRRVLPQGALEVDRIAIIGEQRRHPLSYNIFIERSRQISPLRSSEERFPNYLGYRILMG